MPRLDSCDLSNNRPDLTDRLDRIPQCDGWERMDAGTLAELLRRLGSEGLAEDVLQATKTATTTPGEKTYSPRARRRARNVQM